ncbi:hypothetical protein ACFXTH_002704 [Malus domestica]
METQSENQDIEPINLDQELDLSESSFDDTGRKRKRTSVVWQHFEENNFCGEVKAVCNHCKARLASGSIVGTSSLLSHVRTCPVLTTKKKSPVITGDGSIKYGAYSFDDGSIRTPLKLCICSKIYYFSLILIFTIELDSNSTRVEGSSFGDDANVNVASFGDNESMILCD